MIKQLVTEVRRPNNTVPYTGPVKVTTSYPDNHPVFQMAERKEIKMGNYTYYWVGVPDTVEGGIMPQMEKKQSKKKKLFMKLKKEKLERIARYAAYVEKIDNTPLEKGELKRDKFYDLSSVITDQDRVSARNLARLTKRDPIKILQRNNPQLLEMMMEKAQEMADFEDSQEIDEIDYQRIIRESVAEAS